LQHVGARQGAVGENGRDLQPDDERGADDSGKHLRGEPRALRPDDAKQRDGEGDRDGGGGRAHRQDHAVGAKPMPAAAERKHVDERTGERQRHRGDCERHGGDPHREQALRGDR
jgi:hypothetical protein